MKELTVEQTRQMLICVADTIIKNEPYLTEVDTIIGDGDHGEGMERGFTALKALMESSTYDSFREIFRATGMELVKTMGGASGVLFSTLFIGGLNTLDDADALDMEHMAAFFAAGVEAVLKRGGTKPGLKTMVDALVPAMDAMQEAARQGLGLDAGLQLAYEAALAGVEATKHMKSGVGRSKNFGEKTVGHPDPGAISVSLILRAMCEYVNA